MNIKNIHYIKALDAFEHHSRLTRNELMSWCGISATEKIRDLINFLLKEGVITKYTTRCEKGMVGISKYYERKR